MTIDDRFRSALAQAVGGVRPQPDPLGRLLARRGRRRRRSALVAAVAAIALAGGVAALPAASPRPDGPVGHMGWSQRLVDAEPRGAVAVAEPDFVAELSRTLTAQNRAGETEAQLAGFRDADAIPPAERIVRVLFVDDVGPQRLAVIALLAPPELETDVRADTVLVTIVADKGANAATLAGAVRQGRKPSGTGFLARDLVPFFVAELAPAPVALPGPMAVIGLAPPGCEVASALVADKLQWSPESTGSYVVRAAVERRAEWWRVTCGGVVRHQEPARPVLDPQSPATVQTTAEHVQAAMTDARGEPDPVAAQRAVAGTRSHLGYLLVGHPIVVWGGRTTGIPPSDGDTVVVAAPLVGGGWAGSVLTEFDNAPSTVVTGFAEFSTAADPFAGVLAVWLSHNIASGDGSRVDSGSPTQALVVAPAGAATVVAIRDGEQVAQARVEGGAALLSLSQQPGVTVEALDADGTVLAQTTPVGPYRSQGLVVANWEG